jgi:hypothetical protein
MRKYLIPLALLLLWAGCPAKEDDIAPTVSITAPVDGATVQDTVAVTVTANDNDSVTRVIILIDDAVCDTLTAEPYTYSWITNTLSDSTQHTIYARAYDDAGNEGVSDTISVTVFNGFSLPPPALALPANGSTITQNPPTMVWLPVNQSQIVYRFEVATDSLFGTGAVVYSSGPIIPPDTQFTLPSALVSGSYYWHACTRQDC